MLSNNSLHRFPPLTRPDAFGRALRVPCLSFSQAAAERPATPSRALAARGAAAVAAEGRPHRLTREERGEVPHGEPGEGRSEEVAEGMFSCPGWPSRHARGCEGPCFVFLGAPTAPRRPPQWTG